MVSITARIDTETEHTSYVWYETDETNNGSLKTMNLKDRGLSRWGGCVPVFSRLSILYYPPI